MDAALSDPRHELGGNFPPAEARDQKPRQRDQDQERLWAEYIHEAAMLIACRFRKTKVSATALKGKRGTVEARLLRFTLSAFLRGRVPNWFIAEALELYRGTPAEDADQFTDWIDRDEDFGDQNDNLFSGLDHMLRVDPKFCIDAMRAMYEADQADRVADKKIVEIARARRRLERGERAAKEEERIRQAVKWWAGQAARGMKDADKSLAKECGPAWVVQQLTIPSLATLTELLRKSRLKGKTDQQTAQMRRVLENEFDARAVEPLMRYGLIERSAISRPGYAAPIWISEFGAAVLEAAAKKPALAPPGT